MGGKAITETYQEYLASDVWKCDKSPINPGIPLQVLHGVGTHHWIEVQYADGQLHTGLFYCKWCFDAKKFPVKWEPTKAISSLTKKDILPYT